MVTNLQIIVGGQEIKIPITLTQEQIAELSAAMVSDKPRTGWEKPQDEEPCYYEDALGRVQKFTVDELGKAQLDLLYEKANCYSSEFVANEMARGDALIRNLRRFAVEKRKEPINRLEGGYTITYNYIDQCLEYGVTGNWFALGDVVFDSEETVREAMNLYAEELIWYFTEMTDHI